MNFYILGRNIYGKGEFSDWVVVIKESDKKLLTTDKLFSIQAIKVDIIKKTVSQPMPISEFIKFMPFEEFDNDEDRKIYEFEVESILRNEQEKTKL